MLGIVGQDHENNLIKIQLRIVPSILGIVNKLFRWKKQSFSLLELRVNWITEYISRVLLTNMKGPF